MKKSIIIIFCLILFNCINKQNKHFINKNQKRHITLILGIENRGKLIRGWNDITMLMVKEKNEVKFISFPRDTIIYMSPKGHWTINSMYLVQNIDGMINHFNYKFQNIKIDDYIVYNLNDMDSLIEKIKMIPKLPKEIKNLLKNYEYINDWIRHRHKLRLEIDRQKRIHAFMNYLIIILKRKSLSKITLSIGNKILTGMAEKTSFNNENKISLLYYNIKNKPIKYYIWNGYYKDVYFKLQHAYNKRIFQYGNKTVYVLKHKNLLNITNNYINPYKYTTENFFEITNKLIPIKKKKGIYKKYTKWNGGFVINYKKLISNYSFTNQNWIDSEIYKFCKSFKNNKLTKYQISLIIKYCKKYKINIWNALTQIEKESSLIINNTKFNYEWRENSAMGYGCKVIGTNKKGQRYHKNWGYETQIKKGLRCMRYWFNKYEKNKELQLMSYEGIIKPKNAATYALYKYTPFYSECYPNNNDFLSVGNRRYMNIWYEFNRKKNK